MGGTRSKFSAKSSSMIVFVKRRVRQCLILVLISVSFSWDEWVPESRVLKYVDSNLQKQKELQKANQWVPSLFHSWYFTCMFNSLVAHRNVFLYPGLKKNCNPNVIEWLPVVSFPRNTALAEGYLIIVLNPPSKSPCKILPRWQLCHLGFSASQGGKQAPN